MTIAKKTALIIILIGVCLPTATLPFISEFKPVPELCLTSNFFQNMGNMVVVIGGKGEGFIAASGDRSSGLLSIPYRYLFSLGVVLVCSGLGFLVVVSGNKTEGHR